MSSGHYYQQETGSVYQRASKQEEKRSLFCGFDVKSWFYSSKSVDLTDESLNFNENLDKVYNAESAEYVAVHADHDGDDGVVVMQENKSVSWSIAKTVLLLCIVGSMMGLLFANSDHSTSNGGNDISEFTSTASNSTRF